MKPFISYATISASTKGTRLSYAFYKFIHVLGVIFLVGNVSVTSIWKVFADRTRNPAVVSFAQRLVTHTDWTLTGGGVALTMIGGYGMAWEAQLSLTQLPWLLWSQGLFLMSGLTWLLVLIPLQVVQSRQAAVFDIAGSIPTSYYQLGRWWITWGVLATVPLIAALYVMISKVVPTF